jgi:glycerol-3-phosphate dehydrogenase (NAD(P)+)
MNEDRQLAIIGAGAFGTALAQSLARAGIEVTLWCRNAALLAKMQRDRQSPALPAVTLDAKIRATAEGAAVTQRLVLLAVPLQQLRSLLSQFPQLDGRHLVACCKGIELASGQGPTAIISSELPSARAAILTGPSFAADIAKGLPTALTLACRNEATGIALQQRLTAPNLRIYRTRDVVGAELGGALKNVIAIACGAAIGAGLGDSARAALMTRGFAEMNRMARALGADPATLAGLSGFGDLSLTCSTLQSRNYRFGVALGRGEGFDPKVTVEGIATAKATAVQAAALGIDMPITLTVVGLLEGRLKLGEAIDQLLARPLTAE